jgi:glycyl-tRNA synthetase beta chain
VALADRLDTLVGIFAAGLKPSGNKDPYALRRSALGVLRILLDADFRLPLEHLLQLAADALQGRLVVSGDTLAEVKRFLVERLRHHALETGATARQLAGVLAAPLSTLPDFQARLDAVRRFMKQPEAESLVAANKRIGNILKKQETEISKEIDEDVFAMEEERALFSEIMIVQEGLEELLHAGDYDTALRRLARLREPVDRYFDEVMVMDEDPALRANRLATLNRLKSMFDRIADFSVAD